MSSIRETKVYNINDFLTWHDNEELTISPKYQRNSVWNHKVQSYLIDTIIRGLPIPQIFLRQIIDTKTRKITREVIDGQQRLRAIMTFVNNQYEILRNHNNEYGGLRYSQLPDDVKENFLDYSIPVEIIKIKDDGQIYDMFSRLNTNSVSLNKQELRNSKFWGEFKVFIYRISKEYRDFYIDIKTFNDKQLSRMDDIEFNTTLIMHLENGIQNETATSIDNFYKKYDKEFSKMIELEDRFKFIMDIIVRIFLSEIFSSSLFHRKGYLYTLFCALNFHIFGLDKVDCRRSEQLSYSLINKNIDKIIVKLMEFESGYQKYLDDEFVDQEQILYLSKFEQNHRTRTTSAKERGERISFLASVIGSVE